MLGLPKATPEQLARREVERLHRAEVALADELLRRQAGAPQDAADAGRAFLDEHLEGRSRPRRLALITISADELATCHAAIEDARRRRRDAIRALFVAEAAPLDAQAATLEAEVARRVPKTARLLAELAEWEGVRFVPEQPFAAPATLQLYEVVVQYLPRTDALRGEAAALRARAAAGRARAIPEAGQCEARSVDALLAAVRGLDPTTIGPPLPAVAAWAAGATAPLEARRARATDPADPLHAAALELVVTWHRGVLVAPECRARLIPREPDVDTVGLGGIAARVP